MTLGQYVASARASRGWTQEELARRTGNKLNRAYIAAIERDTIAKPGAKAFLSLSSALNVPLSDLHRAAGLPTTATSPARRESTRELLERALLLAPVPVPVRPLASYGREEQMSQTTDHPDVYVSPSTGARSQTVSAYLLSGDYPEYRLGPGSVIVVDPDAEIDPGDIVLFVNPDGDPSVGTLRRADTELWIEAPGGKWLYKDCQRVVRIIQDCRMRIKPEK